MPTGLRAPCPLLHAPCSILLAPRFRLRSNKRIEIFTAEKEIGQTTKGNRRKSKNSANTQTRKKKKKKLKSSSQNLASASSLFHIPLGDTKLAALIQLPNNLTTALRNSTDERRGGFAGFYQGVPRMVKSCGSPSSCQQVF